MKKDSYFQQLCFIQIMFQWIKYHQGTVSQSENLLRSHNLHYDVIPAVLLAMQNTYALRWVRFAKRVQDMWVVKGALWSILCDFITQDTYWNLSPKMYRHRHPMDYPSGRCSPTNKTTHIELHVVTEGNVYNQTLNLNIWQCNNKHRH